MLKINGVMEWDYIMLKRPEKDAFRSWRPFSSNDITTA